MALNTVDMDVRLDGEITDAQYDYYGAKIAAADTTGKITIEEQAEVTGRELREYIPNAHNGAISQIDWSHPEFGDMLASAGLDDNTVKLWKSEDGSWNCVRSFQFDHSITCLTYVPREYGLKILAGDSKGNIYMISYKDGYWNTECHEQIQPAAVTSIAVGPPSYTISDIRDSQTEDMGVPPLRFLVCCGDNEGKVKPEMFCKVTEITMREAEVYSHEVIEEISQPATDIAWCQNVLNYDTIAIGGKHGELCVLQRSHAEGQWKSVTKIKGIKSHVVRVAWTQTGNILQACLINGETYLYKESLVFHNHWNLISKVSDEGAVEVIPEK